MDFTCTRGLIGTHDSFTYLPIKQWYLKPFSFIAKCQNKDIYEQIRRYNCIDVRIYFGSDCKWHFAHGLVNYKSDDAIEILHNLLIQINKTFYVRLILEKVEDEDCIFCIFDKFQTVCKELETAYPNIKFFGGNYKKDWTKIYDFKTLFDSDVNQFISSMAYDARWYEKICPYLYAKRMNKVNFKKCDKPINLFDFI